MHAPRKGFTLVELLVVIAILGMLAALLVPTIIRIAGGTQVHESFVADVVGKYEVNDIHGGYGSSIGRIEVRRPGSDRVEVLENIDTFSKHNSAVIRAQLSVGERYQFTIDGVRNEDQGVFPNITSVSLIPR